MLCFFIKSDFCCTSEMDWSFNFPYNMLIKEIEYFGSKNLF